MANEDQTGKSAANLIAEAEKELKEAIERNLDRGSRAAAQLDRTLISLSAGALVLSMTFLTRAVVPGRHLLLLLLFPSWFFFILTLILVIFAMHSEQNALTTAVKNASEALEILNKDKSVKVVFAMMGIPLSKKILSQNKTVGLLNYLALAAFIVGVVLLGVFVGFSLWHCRQ